MVVGHPVPVGLRLIDATHGHVHYIDTAVFEYTEGARKIQLKDPANGDQDAFYHRVDSSLPDTLWDSSTFLLPENLGDTSNAVVNLQYAYSNTAYDPTVSGDRTSIQALLNGFWLTGAEMALEADQIGRYRYLKFKFTTESGTKNASLSEVAYTQDLRLRLPSTGRVVLTVNGVNPLGHQLDYVAGDSLDLDVVLQTETGFLDLTGAAVFFALHRNAAAAQEVTVLALGPATMEVGTNPQTGEASVSIPGTSTQGLSGSYLAEVLVVNGAFRAARQFGIHFSRAVVHAGISLS